MKTVQRYLNAELVQHMVNTNFKLIQAYDNTIQGWAYAMDLRDKTTENHSQRVTEMTVNIAPKTGMSDEELARPGKRKALRSADGGDVF